MTYTGTDTGWRLEQQEEEQRLDIYLDKKNVYGKTLYYPNCKRSQDLAKFRGTKTFSLLDALTLQEIGFEIKFKAVNLT